MYIQENIFDQDVNQNINTSKQSIYVYNKAIHIFLHSGVYLYVMTVLEEPLRSRLSSMYMYMYVHAAAMIVSLSFHAT